MRKLSCSALLDEVKSCFSKIIDETTSRNGLMSAYVMFSRYYNLINIFDGQLNPRQLRKTFTRLFAQYQRSKHLELFKYYDNRYLMPLDGI